MTGRIEARSLKDVTGREEAPSSKNPSESELLDRAMSDPAAFGTLYEEYYSKILGYIYRRVLGFAIAEDLTSNTFLKALDGLPAFRREASFSTWLYRIATNEIKLYWRAEKKRRISADEPVTKEEIERIYFIEPEVETKEQRAEKMKMYAELHGCLRALPEKYHTVLDLRYFEKLQVNEIAQVLGKRLGTVKSLIHRGLKKLGRQMGKQNATFFESFHL